MEEKKSDPVLADRKQDHIELAFKSNMANQGPDDRFYYEPMLAGHPDEKGLHISFLGKTLKAPIWVSSMTGGTERSHLINARLATACAKFGLGMGLGSCRPLLQSHDRLKDFDIRSILGSEVPFFANLGIAQIEELLRENQVEQIDSLIELLQADGLIVHVNPLQEWLQPEGDRIQRPPIDIIQQLLTTASYPVIVKEVGQGMGPQSILALLQLPIAAFELAAHGGTNFSKLELLRSESNVREAMNPLTQVGHSANEMVAFINTLSSNTDKLECQQFIISGGIKDFLDGFYFMEKLRFPSIYGMASKFLQFATESQEALDTFIDQQIRGLQLAQAYLHVK